MALERVLAFAPPQVTGVADPADDPQGNIPYDLLLTGIDVVIPLWPSPAREPGERDILTVRYEQPGQPPVEIVNIYTPPDMLPEFTIHIGPQFLQVDGVGQLWYELLDTSDQPSYSTRRNLTVDHTQVPADLEEAKFPHASLFGYLNCQTIPPLWNGVTVKIPPLTGFTVGDRCEVLWRGYSTLNGSGPELTQARKTVTNPSLSDQDIREGYNLIIEPFDVHIEPMVRNASATVEYRLYRGAKLVGVSKLAVVKIDRMIPGETIPCGP